MPNLIIVAGPNGAGKTSFANKHIENSRTDLVYVNADEIARSLADATLSQPELDMRAGREMLQRIDALVDAGLPFMFETTLASLSYARKIPFWRQRGYAVALIYLRLPSVEISIDRVRRRVAQGGHNIPERVIRQRFARSCDYFERYYKSAVDEWYVWDSLEDQFRQAESRKELMNTIIDVQEVQQELDDAARDARTGPADIRAGRFVHWSGMATTAEVGTKDVAEPRTEGRDSTNESEGFLRRSGA